MIRGLNLPKNLPKRKIWLFSLSAETFLQSAENIKKKFWPTDFDRIRPKFKKIFEKGRKKVGNFRIFLKRLKIRKIAENMQKPRPRTIVRIRPISQIFPKKFGWSVSLSAEIGRFGRFQRNRTLLYKNLFKCRFRVIIFMFKQMESTCCPV